MLNIIYSELLKLKKTYIMCISLIGGLIMNIFMALGNLSVGITMSFENFIRNTQQANLLMMNIILFSLISAYVFSREFTDKTANVAYAYPVSRLKIFIGKLITVYLIIFIVYLLQSISAYLAYYAANGIVPPYDLIMKDIKINIISMVFQFLITPITILIANVSKNIMMPTVYGVLSFILLGFIGMESKYIDYVPMAAPLVSSKYFYLSRGINFNHIVSSTLACFFIFMIICVYEFNKKEID